MQNITTKLIDLIGYKQTIILFDLILIFVSIILGIIIGCSIVFFIGKRVASERLDEIYILNLEDNEHHEKLVLGKPDNLLDWFVLFYLVLKIWTHRLFRIQPKLNGLDHKSGIVFKTKNIRRKIAYAGIIIIALMCLSYVVISIMDVTMPLHRV